MLGKLRPRGKKPYISRNLEVCNQDLFPNDPSRAWLPRDDILMKFEENLGMYKTIETDFRDLLLLTRDPGVT
jgi:hypothetical protein